MANPVTVWQRTCSLLLCLIFCTSSILVQAEETPLSSTTDTDSTETLTPEFQQQLSRAERLNLRLKEGLTSAEQANLLTKLAELETQTVRPETTALITELRQQQRSQQIPQSDLREALRAINLQLEQDLTAFLETELTETERAQIEYLEPNYLYALAETEFSNSPNDPEFSNQNGLKQILAAEFPTSQTSQTEKIIVAILDTGIDYNHPDLQANFWQSATCNDESGEAIAEGCLQGGYDFVEGDTDPFPTDGFTHGTNVAGILGAATNNELGMAALSQNQIAIMALRVAEDGLLEVQDIISAVYFAVENGAKVLNMSFGGATYSEKLAEAISYAKDQGVIVVAAAGNYGTDNDLEPIYPANYELANIIAVAALDQNSDLAYFSNYGVQSVDLAAPGVDVLTTTLDAAYDYVSGTSFAAPFVSAIIGSWILEIRDWSLETLEQKLAELPSQASLLGQIKAGRILQLGNELAAEDSAEETAETTEEQDSAETEEPAPTDQGLTKNSKQANNNYAALMRRFWQWQKESIQQPSGESNAELTTARISEAEFLNTDLQSFIAAEKIRLAQLGVPASRQEKYLNRLQQQAAALTQPELAVIFTAANTTQNPVAKIPENPGSFVFKNEEVKVQSVTNFQATPKQTQSAATLQTLDTAILPTLADTQADEQEVIFNSLIQNLAEELNNNPVEITNFVRNFVIYEPYYGAKKGALGCLQEQICNDTDAASLTIALLRAAGIPARYKKSAIVVPVVELQSLLGVTETKTVFAAFAWNEVPIFLEDGSGLDNTTLETADFTNVENLVLEWTYVEAFYEYAERGGNLSNELSFTAATTTTEVQEILAADVDYAKKTWIPIEVIFREYSHTPNEIVAETANFDTASFWRDFFEYQGELAPLEKYLEDLKNLTGKDLADSQYQSTRVGVETSFQILPPTLPYLAGSGTSTDVTLAEETWSTLPDERRSQVRLTLKKEVDDSTVLTQTFFGSAINNQPIELAYEGATDTDQATIESYGGIHATPAELVALIPYFSLGLTKYSTDVPISIGETLILQFEYLEKGEVEHTDEKFSVAGNREGIYLALSRIQEDAFLDDLTDPNQNSKILLEGNAELARQYLKRNQENSEFLEKALDIEHNTIFERAVVTQNRVLSEVNNVPTTFDFQGLTIDAASYIIHYSRRDDYQNHTQDFTLLWGLEGSYAEAQFFTDIAGLEAISTVKGLQYAYANPQEYTVYEIDSSNASTIDSLNLSDNTKANMHADVQAGRTILTPDQFVTSGNWSGIFYVSLEENGAGTYAIGEQVQNGGWTTAELAGEIITYLDGNEAHRFTNTGTTDYFIFEEDTLAGATLCSLSQADYLDILENEIGDTMTYGVPCLRETIIFGEDFGSMTHAYTLTTGGAKFSSPGVYDYWATENEIFEKIDSVANQFSNGQKYNAKFSSILGVHIQSFCQDVPFYQQVGNFFGLEFTDCLDEDQSTIYYSPNANGGSAYLVDSAPAYSIHGGFLDKLGETQYEIDNYPIRQVGYPVINEFEANTYTGGLFDVTGRQQTFCNGQLYMDTTLINENYYVPGKIKQCHIDPTTCGENQTGGTGGWFGFPLDDPYKATDGSWYQPFENEKEIHLQEDGTVTVEELYYYRCEAEAYQNVTNPSKLNFYFANGLFYGAGDLLEGLTIDLPVLIWGIAKSLGSILVHPIETFNTASEIISEIGALRTEIEWEQVWEAVKDEAPELMVQAKDELVEFASDIAQTNLCAARISYLEGYLIGSGLAVGKVLKSLQWGEDLPGEIKAAVGTLAAKGNMIFRATSSLGKSLISKFPAAQTWMNNWVQKGDRWYPNAHHIIPQSFRDHSTYGDLIDELDNLWGGSGKFDLNDAQNGVFLPSGLHTGSHRGDYLNKIYDEISKEISEGQDAVLQKISDIRNAILDGSYERLNDNWLDANNSDLIEALIDTKNIYN